MSDLTVEYKIYKILHFSETLLLITTPQILQRASLTTIPCCDIKTLHNTPYLARHKAGNLVEYKARHEHGASSISVIC